eukprot:3522429-Prymnesium_polylepis.1
MEKMIEEQRKKIEEDQAYECHNCGKRLTSLEIDGSLIHPMTGEPCCPEATCLDQPLFEEDNSARLAKVEDQKRNF